jgi:hypothetical protein
MRDYFLRLMVGGAAVAAAFTVAASPPGPLSSEGNGERPYRVMRR